ncbi:hypothetical protein LNKW23_02460 [Paralimibaculum aggregatum]|uniref:Uncharacterized protein n=1 Tax=Paralimibaculum aggregatum TaxID=3036245 RepID=A0ABQ6LCE1_9RHOB|nr:hypothetical protein LNKW23_02460 [Limibaculum sp. NKW23]
MRRFGSGYLPDAPARQEGEGRHAPLPVVSSAQWSTAAPAPFGTRMLSTSSRISFGGSLVAWLTK